MKVLLINGSPRANGNTNLALEEMVKLSSALKMSGNGKQEIENLLYELVQKAVLRQYTNNNNVFAIRIHSPISKIYVCALYSAIRKTLVAPQVYSIKISMLRVRFTNLWDLYLKIFFYPF